LTDQLQTEVTSSESLPLPQAPAFDEPDDDVVTSHDVVTSSSHDAYNDGDDIDDDDDDESADDETEDPMTSTSAADMKQQVDLGPEVSVFVYLFKQCLTGRPGSSM